MHVCTEGDGGVLIRNEVPVCLRERVCILSNKETNFVDDELQAHNELTIEY